MRGATAGLAAVIAATGAVSSSVLDRAPETAEAKPKPPCPANGHTPKVGKVTIISDKVFRGTSLLDDGNPLYENSTLCAKENGEVRFFAHHPSNRFPTTTCRMDRSSELRIHPKKQNPQHKQSLIRFESGWAWCVTGKDPPENLVQERYKYDANQGRDRIFTKDPLFAVGVDKTRTLIKVDVGFVRVSKATSDKSVIVGPQQQVTIPAGAEPEAPERIEATPKDQAVFDDLRPLLPNLDLTAPDPGGSAALTRIFGKKLLVVGIDRTGSADSSAEAFVQEFFRYLASSWRINARWLYFDKPVLGRSLETGAIDVALTPHARQLDGFDALALFLDREGDVWQAGLVRDPVFKEALRSFISAAVTNARYRSAYLRTFRREPRYEPLSEVLFP